MTKTRRTYPESFKRDAVEQVLAGTPLRHVAHALDITEALLSKWKRQFHDAGLDAFPGRASRAAKPPNSSAFAMTSPASLWSATS